MDSKGCPSYDGSSRFPKFIQAKDLSKFHEMRLIALLNRSNKNLHMPS
jgi:hypothetical protein